MLKNKFSIAIYCVVLFAYTTIAFSQNGCPNPVGHLCDDHDDRVFSQNGAIGRLFGDFSDEYSIGTAWISESGLMVTAGHVNNYKYVEFNVPYSEINGHINHPSAENIYEIDTIIFTTEPNSVKGNDWEVFKA